jgi:hypothetical protein
MYTAGHTTHVENTQILESIAQSKEERCPRAATRTRTYVPDVHHAVCAACCDSAAVWRPVAAQQPLLKAVLVAVQHLLTPAGEDVETWSLLQACYMLHERNVIPTCCLVRGVRVWVVYLTPKERIISLLSASPVGEARLPMPKGMAYKDLLL